MQVTNEEQHILWEEYGLRLHIPHDVLPDDCKLCNLKIAVSLSGNFLLPEDSVLVSGVYSFTHDLGDRKLRKPVTLEMQHCATSTAWSGLRILRASDNCSNKFTVLPGGIFLPDDHYSKIKLDYFSKYLIAFLRNLFSRNQPHPSPPPTMSTPQDEYHPSPPPTISTPQDESPPSPTPTIFTPQDESHPTVSTPQDESHPSPPPTMSIPQDESLPSHPPTVSPQPHPSFSATVSPLEYRAQLYYTDIAYPSFKSNLYILPNLNANFTVCIQYTCINCELVYFYFYILIGNREGDEGGM